MKRISTKKTIAWLHLWVGLLSGLIILISMLGAAIFVWQAELTNWYYSDIIYNRDAGKRILPVSELHQNVSSAYPGKEFNFLLVENDPDRNYAWRSYKKAEEPGWTWPSGIEHYLTVFVNPYTGEVTGHIDKRTDWITLSRFLHQTLLLEYELGTKIIGFAGLIMIVLAISGLVIWWPKTLRSLKQRLKIKWKAAFKRVNWDLHAVGGVYTYLFILFFATTGLVWSYSWWKNGIVRLLGDDPKEIFVFPEPPKIDESNYLDGMDIAYLDALTKNREWTKIYFSVPKATMDKGRISTGIYYNRKDSWWNTNDYYYYDPKTGEQYDTFTHDEKLLSEKWRHSNYDMHVGSIYGLPTKIIAFICALFFAFLPISGFLIWWDKQKKKKIRKANGLKPRKPLNNTQPKIKKRIEEKKKVLTLVED
ncbi:MAG: PepSY-associated TM helix domain-containing protein [Bacteroidota bacterium]